MTKKIICLKSVLFLIDETLVNLMIIRHNDLVFVFVYCLVPSSSPVERVLSITGNTQNKIRNRLNPNQLANLTLLKMNR